MMIRKMGWLGTLVFSFLLAAGCQGDDGGAGGGDGCIANQSRPCTCADGATGAQLCGSDGSYGECECGSTAGGPAAGTGGAIPGAGQGGGIAGSGGAAGTGGASGTGGEPIAGSGGQPVAGGAPDAGTPGGVLLGVSTSDREFPGQMREIRIEGPLDTYPRAFTISPFDEYPQTDNVSCGPNAVRNALMPVVGVLYDDSDLLTEAVAADQEGLAQLEQELLEATGGLDPRLLSAYGTTPIGNAVILTKYLAENGKPLIGAFAAIPSLDDRLLLLVDRISKGYPVCVPCVSGDYNHWVTAYGYDLDAGVIHVVNGGGSLSFAEFDEQNSFTTMSPGILANVYNLAAEHGLGRTVLLFMWEK